MCVCVYIYIHISIDTYLSIHPSIHSYLYIYLAAVFCSSSSVLSFLAAIHIYICLYIPIYLFIYMHTCIHTNIHLPRGCLLQFVVCLEFPRRHLLSLARLPQGGREESNAINRFMYSYKCQHRHGPKNIIICITM